MKKYILLTTLLIFSIESQAATSLVIGDVSIVGYRSDAPDQFSFVTWVDLDASTEISFTDRGWINSVNDFTTQLSDTDSFFAAADGTLTWTSGQNISAGTIVTATFADNNPDTATWTLGSSTGDFGSTALSSGGESIFAFQGGMNNPSLLFGFYFRDADWETGLDSSITHNNDSELPNVLNVANGNFVAVNGTSPNDNGIYTGPFTGDLNTLRSSVNNRDNWLISNNSTEGVSTNIANDFASSSFTIIPEPSSTTLLGIGSLALLCRRKRK